MGEDIVPLIMLSLGMTILMLIPRLSTADSRGKPENLGKRIRMGLGGSCAVITGLFLLLLFRPTNPHKSTLLRSFEFSLFGWRFDETIFVAAFSCFLIVVGVLLSVLRKDIIISLGESPKTLLSFKDHETETAVIVVSRIIISAGISALVWVLCEALDLNLTLSSL